MRSPEGSRKVVAVAFAGAPALVLAAFSANPALTIFAVATLSAIVLLVFRTGEAPVMLFVCFMQWIQGSLKLLQADALGEPVWKLASSRTCDTAIAMTMAWAVAIALGFRIAISFKPAPRSAGAIEALDVPALLRLYVAWTIVVQLMGPLAQGGSRQLIVAIADIRWAVVFALFWTVLKTRRHYAVLGGVFVIELVSGLFSFFSSFKIPIYLLALALPAGNYAIRPRHVFATLIVTAFALYLGVLWTAIKADYRSAISGGTMEQTVKVGIDEQARELIDLSTDLDKEAFARGVTNLLDRISYVDFFALAIDFVPAVRPHESGLLWGNALRHVLTPRLFFPDKAELESDTEISRRYTGATLTLNPNTSISLGTPAESYVDFGIPFMLAPGVFVGVLCGLVYRVFAAYGMLAMAQGFTVAALLSLGTVELTPSKLLGGLLTRLIIAVLLWQFLLNASVYLVRRRPAVSRAQPR
jgi:hypothetical protein